MQKEESKATRKTVMIVAAEASSSLYAQRLLEYWKNQKIEVKTFGVGSREMEALGFECLGRSEELAVVGVSEVISHFGKIRQVFYSLVEQVRVRKPDVILLLDYPDFNFRLAKKLKPFGIPIVYYISPQLWAWRTSRIKLVQKFIDKMLVLFPFEVDFYKNFGVHVEFVGHPLLDEMKRLSESQTQDVMIERRRYGFADHEFVLGLMPGSRNSELKHHLQTQIQVAEHLVKKHSDLKVAFLVAPNFDMEDFRSRLGNLDFQHVLIQDEPFRMIRLTNAILVASGTATLMVGLMETPMVIMYKMKWLSGVLAKWFVNKTPFFGLINLVIGRKVVPELFQEQANIENLCEELERFIKDPILIQKTKSDLSEVKNLLGKSGATKKVAESLREYFQ